MLQLKKKYYPAEWILGCLCLSNLILPEIRSYNFTIQVIILTWKSKTEGFRFNIFFYALSVFLELFTFYIALIALFIYFYLTHKLVNYELPDDGIPVGHKYIKGGWLKKYQNIPEMAIYYPAQQEDCKQRQYGFKWLKVSNYAKYMDDTAKKDINRPRHVPYLFFKIVVTQFYKFIMHVYENAQIDLKAGENNSKFSVIILSHGLASHCDGYSVVARYLAQCGHIVFVPEHQENIRNIYKTNEENRQYRIDQLQDRIATIKQVLDIIYDEKQFTQIFDNSKVLPNYNEISIIGHSFGGSTAYAIAQIESRITGACIMYDPCMYIFDFDKKLKLHIPLLSINADDFYRRLYPFMENDQRLEKAFKLIDGPISDHCLNIYLKDQQHADFSDIPIIWNGEAGLYSISKNVHQVHLRFGMILTLTKIFLQEANNYHKIKENKNESNGNQELQQLILNEISKNFGQESRKLIRWDSIQKQ